MAHVKGLDVIQVILQQMHPQKPLGGALGTFHEDPVTVFIQSDAGLAGLNHYGTGQVVTDTLFFQTVLDVLCVDIIAEYTQVSSLFSAIALAVHSHTDRVAAGIKSTLIQVAVRYIIAYSDQYSICHM